jgi:hypothetical protein
MTTLKEIKALVAVGDTFYVTNHYIRRTDHPCYGTNRRMVLAVSGSSFTLSSDGPVSGIAWPKASQVTLDDAGAIHILGGGCGQPADAPFLTLKRVLT